MDYTISPELHSEPFFEHDQADVTIRHNSEYGMDIEIVLGDSGQTLHIHVNSPDAENPQIHLALVKA